VSRDDVATALDELVHETAALTRVLLGSEAPGEGPAPTPHGWIQGIAGASVAVQASRRPVNRATPGAPADRPSTLGADA